MSKTKPLNILDQYHTLPEAAELLNIKVHALRRAVKKAEVPCYRPFNSGKMVKPSEIIAIMEARNGGGSN